MLVEKIQLEDDEHILIQVRRHWFVLCTELAGLLLAGLLPVFIHLVVLRYVSFESLRFTISNSYIVFLYAVWFLFLWMALFSSWTNYYLDVWTITNKRLVSVNQHGLFNRNTGSLRLERIQDIDVTVKGMLATFLDFGLIRVETASEDRDFAARNIPKPQELKALILSASDKITFGNFQSSQIKDGL